MADAPQNFTDMFKSLGEQLKVPAFDMAKIMEHHQKNLDAMTRSWQAMAGGASEIANKQREIFEAAMKELESIVRALESGSADLDKAIADYGRGNALKEHCLSKLAEAKLKVEQINVKADGTITKKEFASE